MRHMKTHMQWLTRLTAGDSGRTIAQKAGASVATINRQIGKEEVTAENVIAIARGYGQSPVEALAQTGYLTADEASGLPRESLADLLTDQELIRALALRVDDNEDAWEGTFTEVVDNVSHLPSNDRVPPESEPRPDHEHDGTVRDFDWEPGTYAADNSTNEGKAREERGEDPID